MSISTKSVFISGAGRGIGRAIAERFLAEGYLVGAYTVSGNFAWGEGNPNVVQGQMDVRDPESFKAAMEDFMTHTGGRLDILVNNAGVAVIGEYEDQSIEDIKELFDVDVVGYFNGIDAALPYLKATPQSQIVNISSASSYVGTPDLSAYSAAKFAVRGLTEALDIEFLKYDIRVIDINPLFVKTDMVMNKLATGYTIPVLDTLGLKLVPEDVADVVWEATRPKAFKSPKVHYAVGNQAKALSLQHLLPNALPRAITIWLAKRMAAENAAKKPQA